jgi:hypothetical protein
MYEPITRTFNVDDFPSISSYVGRTTRNVIVGCRPARARRRYDAVFRAQLDATRPNDLRSSICVCSPYCCCSCRHQTVRFALLELTSNDLLRLDEKNHSAASPTASTRDDRNQTPQRASPKREIRYAVLPTFPRKLMGQLESRSSPHTRYIGRTTGRVSSRLSVNDACVFFGAESTTRRRAR